MTDCDVYILYVILPQDGDKCQEIVKRQPGIEPYTVCPGVPQPAPYTHSFRADHENIRAMSGWSEDPDIMFLSKV